MTNQEVINQLYKIEELARKIIRQGRGQQQGTEYQKWTYAVLKARKIIENGQRH